MYHNSFALDKAAPTSSCLPTPARPSNQSIARWNATSRSASSHQSLYSSSYSASKRVYDSLGPIPAPQVLTPYGSWSHGVALSSPAGWGGQYEEVKPELALGESCEDEDYKESFRGPQYFSRGLDGSEEARPTPLAASPPSFPGQPPSLSYFPRRATPIPNSSAPESVLSAAHSSFDSSLDSFDSLPAPISSAPRPFSRFVNPACLVLDSSPSSIADIELVVAASSSSPAIRRPLGGLSSAVKATSAGLVFSPSTDSQIYLSGEVLLGLGLSIPAPFSAPCESSLAYPQHSSYSLRSASSDHLHDGGLVSFDSCSDPSVPHPPRPLLPAAAPLIPTPRFTQRQESVPLLSSSQYSGLCFSSTSPSSPSSRHAPSLGDSVDEGGADDDLEAESEATDAVESDFLPTIGRSRPRTSARASTSAGGHGKGVKRQKIAPVRNSAGTRISDVLREMNITRADYDALPSARKRQIRNKVSARTFRARRKERVEDMESVVQQKDQALGQMDREMEELRAELARVKSANATLTEQLSSL